MTQSKPKTRKQLIAAAARKNMLVSVRNGVTYIRKSPKGIGVALYADGAIYRTDVRLDLCLNMRVREAVALLGL